MAWSTKYHPRRFARRDAISPPPLPYSRERVMAHIRLMRSIFSFMTCPSCMDLTLAKWCCRDPLMSLSFTLLRRLTTRTKTLRSAERRKSTVHFLKYSTQLVLFFFRERGHKLPDVIEALWQHVLKKVKRLLCEFNAKHPSIFRMLSAFDQPRTLQAGQ